MRRRAVLALVAGAGFGGASALLGSCARGERQMTGGGLVTPSPVRVTVNPSAPPLGDTVPTGIAFGGVELVLFVWHARPTIVYLAEAWYDHATGTASDRPRFPERGGGEPGDPHLQEMRQIDVGDGTLIEYGAVLGTPAQVVIEDGGRRWGATFARWTGGVGVTLFWLHRPGTPIPESVPDGAGGRSPLPEDRYPLITASDAAGNRIARARLRPGWSRPPSDG